MTFTAGMRLGPYEIVAPLGAGGMGEVYRARDTKLDREVAIKVLPDTFARDPERIARFQREAKVLASLNHSNIAAIHGFEESDGKRFLVLELVEGETLAERLRGGALPVDEALEVCEQIAEALEAAHEHGIIHRDLKPGNVEVTPDGVVKVLDFGLAKAFAGDTSGAALADSPTITADFTRPGVVLGTAAYMSPEQARAKPLDKRTDIWSFGVVLYECLTGRRPFDAETTSDIVAKILERDPDYAPLPDNTPLKVRDLLQHCLEKNRKRRLRDIGDAVLELDEAIATRAWSTSALSAAVGAAAFRKRRLRLSAMAAIILILGIVLGVVLRSKIVPTTPVELRRVAAVKRWSIHLPEEAPLATARSTLLGVGHPAVGLSPDGSRLVYVAAIGRTTQLYLRPMDSLEATPIPETEGAFDPFFSPDSKWVGFFADGKLKKVSVLGGGPVTLCEARNPYGGSWGPDDTIVFAPREGSWLSRISADGGVPQVVARTEGLSGFFWPQVLPDGKAVLCGQWVPGITVVSLETGERRDVIKRGRFARYAPTGHLLYTHRGTIAAVPFDLGQRKVVGSPAPVLENVRTEGYNQAAQFTFSEDGTLVFARGRSEANRTLLWVDRQGAESPLNVPAREYETFDISLDGRKLAVGVTEVGSDIWIHGLQRGTWTRLTVDGVSNFPVWTPDGKRVMFASARDGKLGVFWKRADGTGEAERITTSELYALPTSWSPDGQVLAYSVWGHPDTQDDIWFFSFEGDGKPRVFLRTPFTEWGAMFSPDGRWIAYTSDESGRYDVYVRPYPGPGERRLVSTEGGEEPIWSPTGEELFYRNGDKWMVVPVTTEPEFLAGPPRLLFEGPYVNVPGPSYDIAPDGQRFLVIGSELGPPATRLNVVLNWFEELRAKVPAGK